MYKYRESMICTYNTKEAADDVTELLRLNIKPRFITVKQMGVKVKYTLTIKTAEMQVLLYYRELTRLLINHPELHSMEVNGLPNLSTTTR